jgi:hypothetical protein
VTGYPSITTWYLAFLAIYKRVHFVDGAIRSLAETLHEFFRLLKLRTKRKDQITPRWTSNPINYITALGTAPPLEPALQILQIPVSCRLNLCMIKDVNVRNPAMEPSVPAQLFGNQVLPRNRSSGGG